MHQHILRPLGGPEKLFLVLDQIASKSFALVVSLEGELPPQALRLAVDAVQKRHPQLSASIKMDAAFGFWFATQGATPIPLRVIDTDTPSDWQKVVEEELALPFEVERGPLLRLTQLRKPGESTLIGIVHHTIGDGYSLALLFHDLFSFVTGQPLHALPATKSMDELLHLTPSSSMPQAEEANLAFRPIGLEQTALAIPSIDYLRVSAELTARLVAVSHQYATTVNTLLNAALLVAGAKLTASWRERPVVLRSPASIREAVQPSPYTVPETIDRVQALLLSHGATIYTRIDQQAELRSVGQSIRPLQFLLFGNPRAGGPLLAANPLVALDLPLKIIAWENDQTQVIVVEDIHDAKAIGPAGAGSTVAEQGVALKIPVLHNASLSCFKKSCMHASRRKRRENEIVGARAAARRGRGQPRCGRAS
uniref:Condensation domain-containing protein n=1 Tax=Tanacetum cinerariifolium TaxID=118510 RepID=A0A699JP46_TANCI|nr:hypothetical protein [Tanacetum cinerariifolium]